MARRISVFVSSPADVGEERRQCGEVIEELNATMRALIPERDVVLDLIRWETHTFPDIKGSPQGVIDAQIGLDYDIYVGIMWSRFGTPTASGGSGTADEFQAALRGSAEAGRPSHLLFYFCNTPIPVQFAGEFADQLIAIHKFHNELRHLGLVVTYEDRERFGDRLRRDLVLAVSRVLHAEEIPAAVAQEGTVRVTDADLEVVRQQVNDQSSEYQRLRDTMPPGDQRTRRMEVVASHLRSLAPSTYPLLPELVADQRPGHRLAAVCALQTIPKVEHVEWVGDRVCTEKPFVGYHAALALLDAARILPEVHLSQLAAALDRAEECSRRLGSDTDRRTTLAYARRELARRQEVASAVTR